MTQYKPTSLSISPTIVIGVGGSGVKVVRLVKSRIKNSLSPLPGIVEFLVLDTEPRSNPPGAESERIADGEYVYLGDYNASKVLKNLEVHPHIKHWWFENRDLVTGSIYKGARQRRPVGRLSLYVNWGKFSHPLEIKAEKIREITRKEREQARGIEVERHTGNVKAYIVGSLCGGTGSGILLDVAFKVREVLGDDVDISGVFMLPSCFLRELQSRAQKERIQANAYAALREINHFLQGYPFRAVFPDRPYTNGQSADKENVITRPFNTLYLVDRNNGKEGLSSLEDVFAMIAQYVFLDIVSPIKVEFDAKRSNLSDLAGESSKVSKQSNAQSLAISTFVTASLALPSNELSLIAFDEFCEKFIRQRIVSAFVPSRETSDSLDTRFRAMDESFRFERIDGRSSVSARDKLVGTVSSRIQVDLSRTREVIQEVLTQIKSDLERDFAQYGFNGAHAIIEAMEIRIKDRIQGLDTEISVLEKEQTRIRESLSVEKPSASLFGQIGNSVLKLVMHETPWDKRQRAWEDQQSLLRSKLGQSQIKLDQERQSRKAFTQVQSILGEMKAEIQERRQLFSQWLESIWVRNPDAETTSVRTGNGNTRQGNGFFALSTEIALKDCRGFLNHKTAGQLNAESAPGQTLKPEDERMLILAFREKFFNCELESDAEGAVLKLTSLSVEPVGLAKQMLQDAFEKVVSPERLRIIEYLQWFYRNKGHDGRSPRFTPIDPLQMLKDRCQYPFLQLEPANLGERTSDTEDVRLIGIDQSSVEDRVVRDVMEDFDAYEEVITAVPERIDVLFSRHGYPVRVLRDLEKFKEHYEYFMNSKGEKLHLHRDWPEGMADLCDFEPPDGLEESDLARDQVNESVSQ